MLTVYGLRNCDTMKKAFAWLDAAGLAWTLHDYRKQGAPAGLLTDWQARLGWEALVNRKGTTWRRLDEATREGLDAAGALRLMLEQPSVIRRPIIPLPDGRLLIGFDADVWRAALLPPHA
ncbi:MAG: ArsC family reductase [Halothiobacillaceae bacterium]|nr:ArsC family reductase [Halothiobacillaceae bacterium]